MCRLVSVPIRYSGKTGEWIRMELGIVGRVGLCIGVLDFDGDHRRGRGILVAGEVRGIPL